MQCKKKVILYYLPLLFFSIITILVIKRLLFFINDCFKYFMTTYMIVYLIMWLWSLMFKHEKPLSMCIYN